LIFQFYPPVWQLMHKHGYLIGCHEKPKAFGCFLSEMQLKSLAKG